MTGGAVDPSVLAQQNRDQELVRFKQRMDGLKDRLDGGKSKDEQLKEACRDFEAVFIGKLWKEMQSTVPKEGYLHGKQEEMYLSMFDRQFSEKMADSGGIGLADLIYDQLSGQLQSSSKDTLPGNVEIKPLAENGKPEMNPLTFPGDPMPLNAPQAPEAMLPDDLEAQASASSVTIEELDANQVQARVDELARNISNENRKQTTATASARKSGKVEPAKASFSTDEWVPAEKVRAYGKNLSQEDLPEESGQHFAKIG